MSATRSYESDRNLVDYVQNDVDGSTVSKYDYTNDDAGKRTDVVMTGTAFDSDTFNKYGYNSRDEVTSGQNNGTDSSDTSDPVTSYDYDLDYDPIGNQETYTDAGTQTDYTSNSLNQYESVNNELELSTRWWEWEFDWTTQPQHDADGNITYLPAWSGNSDPERRKPVGRGRQSPNKVDLHLRLQRPPHPKESL